MAAAVERIVVQTTSQDKKAISAKATRLKLPLSELMRRGAFAYQSECTDAEVSALADAANTSMIKLEDKVGRQAEAMKIQQLKIEDLTARVIRLEAQLEVVARTIAVFMRTRITVAGVAEHQPARSQLSAARAAAVGEAAALDQRDRKRLVLLVMRAFAAARTAAAAQPGARRVSRSARSR